MNAEEMTDNVNWRIRVGADPMGGFGWQLWTDHSLWLPLPVTGTADSEEAANAVAREVAIKCTDAASASIRRTGARDVVLAPINVFPDNPVGGGSAVNGLSLAADVPGDKQDRWSGLESRVVEWQTRGGRQRFVALDSREEQSGERLRELFGCMGALGEQATLACAAARDLAVAVASPELPLTGLVRRAWAEHVMHWTMAAGHMLLNVAGRAVALDPTVRPHLVERLGATSERARKQALRTDFPPESDANQDWPTFNKTNANYLKRAAAESRVPAVLAIGGLVHRLSVDSGWVAMSALRGEAFHRWRAQTAGVSPMTRRATRLVGDDGLLPTGQVPDVRGPEGSAKAVQVAQVALELLGTALKEFDSLLPDVMRSLTSSVMHADGLLSSHGSIALVESAPGTGVLIMSIKSDRAHDFLRAIARERPGRDD